MKSRVHLATHKENRREISLSSEAERGPVFLPALYECSAPGECQSFHCK